MSNPTTLADVLKGAPEVTSLESADRLLAVDANGDQKKISRYNLVPSNLRDNTYSETNKGWIRIASSSIENFPTVATVYFTDGLWAGYPSGNALIFVTRYVNGEWAKPHVRVLGNLHTTSEVRTVKTGMFFHLEVKGANRRLMVSCEGINIKTPDTLESPVIPSDATIYTYTAAELSGGG